MKKMISSLVIAFLIVGVSIGLMGLILSFLLWTISSPIPFIIIVGFCFVGSVLGIAYIIYSIED